MPEEGRAGHGCRPWLGGLIFTHWYWKLDDMYWALVLRSPFDPVGSRGQELEPGLEARVRGRVTRGYPIG